MRNFSLLIGVLALSSCALGDMASREGPAGFGATADGPRSIITIAYVDVLVADFPDADKQLTQILAAHHGYVMELRSSPEKAHGQASYVLRVPTDNLGDMLTELRTLGRVTSEEIVRDDVTREHVDMKARLRNLQSTETRLLELQATKTGELADVLLLEKEISRVRGEIESLVSQRDALENRIELATVHLSVEGNARVAANYSTSAFTNSISTMGVAMSWFGVGMIYVLPWLVLLIALWIGIAWLRVGWRRFSRMLRVLLPDARRGT